MTPAEKFITLKLITEYKITSFGKKEFNLAELLTEFAEKQESFISSNPLVIKSVCDHHRIYSEVDGFAYCQKCGDYMQ